MKAIKVLLISTIVCGFLGAMCFMHVVDLHRRHNLMRNDATSPLTPEELESRRLTGMVGAAIGGFGGLILGSLVVAVIAVSDSGKRRSHSRKAKIPISD